MIEAIKEWEKINEQQKEYIKVIKGDIESLKESYKIAHEYNEVADKEIERLNNIINEFEEWLISEIKFRKIVNKDFELRKALTILQELKGSSNNEK